MPYVEGSTEDISTESRAELVYDMGEIRATKVDACIGGLVLLRYNAHNILVKELSPKNRYNCSV